MAFFVAYITISCPIENNNAMIITTTDSIEGRGILAFSDFYRTRVKNLRVFLNYFDL